MGLTSLPVRARAVAKQGFSTACIYALDPTAKSALNFGGNATMNLGCGAVSESSDPKSIDISNNVNISLTNGARLGTVGVYNNNGTVSPTYAIDGKILNPGDPLSGLAMPTYSTQTCFDQTTWSMISTTGGAKCNQQSANLSTGTYSP